MDEEGSIEKRKCSWLAKYFLVCLCPLTRVTRQCCATAGPFSHRALLTLAEKHVPHKEEYIDFNNKPKWCAARAQ